MRTFSAITSRRPFTFLGILLAVLVLVAFILVALNASQAGASPQQTVVVATRDLQPRIPITADALTTRELPVPGNYPKVYFSAASEVLGMIPLVAIQSGQVIASNDVVRPSQALGSQSEYLAIPTGYVALTIPTSEQQGVAGYIQPGDYITLIATVTSSSRTATKTIFTQLHVIKVGTATSSGNAASSLTVVVSQCQAEVLTWFISNTALKYSLESYHDYLSGGEPAPDPNCKQITDAKGVTLQIIQQSYPTLFPA